ncbi:hypothetical protein EB796_007588 [Bugula neritina]|uniref:Uncharacterized protein n=1 Tax=Bugula neritina TaxID=10212 RepID=A0A7J7K665_BUGNE|nr:hypothetical protein EB796_007588 [Bugula neritina]
MDLKKYKAWTPSSGQSSNLEYTNSITKFVRNYKSTLAIGLCVGIVCAGCYAAIIQPMSHVDSWQTTQRENRRGINQEDIQPGGMRVWSDPFNRRK